MSLFKIIFLLVILFAAYGLVVILLRRLTQTTQQLAKLHEQMRSNDARLSNELRQLQHEQERQRARTEAERIEAEKQQSPDDAKDS